MDMFTVLTPNGTIVCRSRLLSVAIDYMTDDTILYVNGEPSTVSAFELAA